MVSYRALIVVGSLVLFYISLEIVQRRWHLRAESTRKFAHVVSGLVAAAALYWVPYQEYLIVLTFFTVVFCVARWRHALRSINLENRVTFGEVLFPVALLMVVAMFYSDKFIATSSLLVMALADPAAALAGDAAGLQRKTWAGSLAFFCVAWFVLMVVAATYGWAISWSLAAAMAAVAAAGAAAEYISPYGLDNLTVPLLTAAMLWLGV